MGHFVGFCRNDLGTLNILVMRTVLFAWETEPMKSSITVTPAKPTKDLIHWQAMLADRSALIARPGAHHKALLIGARALYTNKVIDSDDLCGLLELADGALAFAVEWMHDVNSDE
ncbi:hypothetical protein SAMN03159312_4609 [Pseudomonas sp. NFIX49]|nr:hypothetical protein SAMN03159313_4748 [Pseudomonas sp. NFIX46]SDB46405.1 hypothetical protein SAMN03097715_03431 [Pseudomonas putida]SFQ91867.1 hypothetical protein SAMN03159312_4609 [Pseudomonas sp. NFIX49]